MSGKPTKLIGNRMSLARASRMAVEAMNLPEDRGTVIDIGSDVTLPEEVDDEELRSLLASELANGRITVIVTYERQPIAEPPNLFPRGYVRDIVRVEHPKPVWPGPSRERRFDRQPTVFNTYRQPHWRSRNPVNLRRR